MVSLFSIKQKLLKRQLRKVDLATRKREARLKKEAEEIKELNRLKAQIKQAGKVKLSKEQREVLGKKLRGKSALQRSRIVFTAPQFKNVGAGLSRLLDDPKPRRRKMPKKKMSTKRKVKKVKRRKK